MDADSQLCPDFSETDAKNAPDFALDDSRRYYKQDITEVPDDYKTYLYRVQAKNIWGWGPWSDKIEVLSPRKPLRPTLLPAEII